MYQGLSSASMDWGAPGVWLGWVTLHWVGLYCIGLCSVGFSACVALVWVGLHWVGFSSCPPPLTCGYGPKTTITTTVPVQPTTECVQIPAQHSEGAGSAGQSCIAPSGNDAEQWQPLGVPFKAKSIMPSCHVLHPGVLVVHGRQALWGGGISDALSYVAYQAHYCPSCSTTPPMELHVGAAMCCSSNASHSQIAAAVSTGKLPFLLSL